MVPLGRSLVFPYPTVQYIPIAMEWVEWFDNPTVYPFIQVTRDSQTILSHWERINKTPIALPLLAENEAFLLVTGMTVKEIRYRGFYAIALGALSNTGFVAKIPTHYFYKDPIVFQVKDEKGVTLGQCQFTAANAKPLDKVR